MKCHNVCPEKMPKDGTAHHPFLLPRRVSLDLLLQGSVNRDRRTLDAIDHEHKAKTSAYSLMIKTPPGARHSRSLDVIRKRDHADSLPDSQPDPRGDTPVQSLDPVLLVDVRQRVGDRLFLGGSDGVGGLHGGLHLDSDDCETFQKLVGCLYAQSRRFRCSPSIGWFQVAKAPPILAAAILSKAPNCSCSLFPLTFLIALSARRAKPILYRRNEHHITDH
jgi:hypothetical protein